MPVPNSLHADSTNNPWYPFAGRCDDDELIDWRTGVERLLSDPDLEYPESTSAFLELELQAIDAIERRRAARGMQCPTPAYTVPSEFLKTLKDRVDLTQLIALDVDLRRAGRSYKGRCPFHDDKTPSLVVWPDGWRCFGCGAHGDAIKWIMATQGVGFRASCRWLAAWIGVPFPERQERKRREDGRARWPGRGAA